MKAHIAEETAALKKEMQDRSKHESFLCSWFIGWHFIFFHGHWLLMWLEESQAAVQKSIETATANLESQIAESGKQTQEAIEKSTEKLGSQIAESGKRTQQAIAQDGEKTRMMVVTWLHRAVRADPQVSGASQSFQPFRIIDGQYPTGLGQHLEAL